MYLFINFTSVVYVPSMVFESIALASVDLESISGTESNNLMMSEPVPLAVDMSGTK